MKIWEYMYIYIYTRTHTHIYYIDITRLFGNQFFLQFIVSVLSICIQTLIL